MKTNTATRLLLAAALLAAPLAAALSLTADGPVVLTAGPPRAVHLSLTGADGEMAATWFTNGTTDPGTVVEYGLTPALGLVATGTTQPAPGVNVLVHAATMTGLPPGAVVHYRVGSPAGWSQVFSFRTDDGDGRFRAVAWGDMGYSERAVATRDHAIALAPELVLIAGDLSYANGKQERWDVWFDLMEPLFATVPLMPAIGNHEGGEEGAFGTRPYRARLTLPGEELFYSFDYGRTHFMMHDSDTAQLRLEGKTEAAILFLKNDLEAADARRERGELDRIVVVQHHPIYSNSKDTGRQVFPDLVATEEPWLHANAVDLVLAAHNHHYERTHRMGFDQRTDALGIGYVQAIVGGGGQSLYDFRDPNDFKPWSAAHARAYHLLILDVDGARIDARAYDTWYRPGFVFDAFSIG